MAWCSLYRQRDCLDEPICRGVVKEWWFTVRWEWMHRNWAPTRQKMKAYHRDLTLYRESGRTPW